MIEGKYTVVSKNTLTGVETIKHEQVNLITDYGLNYFGENSKTKTTNSNWELEDCGVWLEDFAEPSVLLEELPLTYLTGTLEEPFRNHFVYNYNTTPTLTNNRTFDDGTSCYIESTMMYTFNQGALVGDMFGVYLGCSNPYGTSSHIKYNDKRVYPWYYNPKSTSGGTSIQDHAFSIFSALKFKDDSGVNTSIPVTSIEQIFIRYTLRRYLPKYVAPRVFNFETDAGTSHVCTIEPRYWDPNYNGSYYSNSRSAFTKFRSFNAENSSSIGVFGGGSSTSASSGTTGFYSGNYAYVNNSYRQGTSYSMSIEFFNKPIEYIDFYNTMGSVRAVFTPPIPKDNTLSTSFQLYWGWGREEDLITNFEDISVINPNFEEDLSGWDIGIDSPLIHFIQREKPSLSLRIPNKNVTFSQTLDISDTILEDRRITCKFKLEGVTANLASITLEFLTNEDEVLSTTVLGTSNMSVGSLNSPLFVQKNIPVEAITAQKIKATFKLSTNSGAGSYISITDIEFILNNITAITG